MKQLMMALLAVLITVAVSAPAEARHHHRHHHYRTTTTFSASRSQYQANYAVYQRQMAEYHAAVGHVVGGRPSGCPSAYCGCGVSLKVFGRIIPRLNLASNWYSFPSASPGPGMVAVRNHHVMLIEHMDSNGNAVVYDPNSGGHATRIHTVSLRGYHIVNPHGSRMARI